MLLVHDCRNQTYCIRYSVVLWSMMSSLEQHNDIYTLLSIFSFSCKARTKGLWRKIFDELIIHVSLCLVFPARSRTADQPMTFRPLTTSRYLDVSPRLQLPIFLWPIFDLLPVRPYISIIVNDGPSRCTLLLILINRSDIRHVSSAMSVSEKH